MPCAQSNITRSLLHFIEHLSDAFFFLSFQLTVDLLTCSLHNLVFVGVGQLLIQVHIVRVAVAVLLLLWGLVHHLGARWQWCRRCLGQKRLVGDGFLNGEFWRAILHQGLRVQVAGAGLDQQAHLVGSEKRWGQFCSAIQLSERIFKKLWNFFGKLVFMHEGSTRKALG